MNGNKNICILAEHRKGSIRDITWEMLNKGRKLASEIDGSVIVLLLGYEVQSLVDELAQWSDEVIYINNEQLQYYNSEAYSQALENVVNQIQPLLCST